jgi:hypothetical protein
MNWTFKLLAVALTALASISLDLYAQSTLDSPLNKALEQPRQSSCVKLPSLESIGACGRRSGDYNGSAEPYADAEAYQVYSAIIPKVPPNPGTKTYFIRIDTLPISGSLDGQARKLWKQTRGADTALDDHYQVNRQSWLLQRKFTLPNPYKLVTREQLPHFRGGNFGEVWLELSAVGFNADKTVAVVYMLGGDKGTSFVLEKQNGNWEVSSETGCGIF